MTCKYCKTDLPLTDAYCSNCGKSANTPMARNQKVLAGCGISVVIITVILGFIMVAFFYFAYDAMSYLSDSGKYSDGSTVVSTNAPFATPVGAPAFSPWRWSSCSALVNKITTLNISPENIIAPQNTEFPEGFNKIDFTTPVPLPLSHTDTLMCSAKVKIASGDYPVRMSVITENSSEYIVIESQGKRKWILKWLND
jgi:hypothetical protein